MKAVIMAGGEGTRLRPLTSNWPKPLLPIANRPMMEHVIDLLKRHGITDVVVTVAFMANAIKDYFADGREFGVTISYVDEPTPLGTAGSVRNAADLLSDERFLVISGDVITDIDLSRIMKFHVDRGAVATIGLTPVENPLEFGIVITREDGTIERFLEKPTWGQVFSDTINTGIYVLEPEIFDYVATDRPVDFSSEVFPRLLEDGKPLFGAVSVGYWEDVGTLEAYLSAHKDVLDQMVALDIPGFEVGNGVWVGEGTELAPDAVVEGPAVIGPECTIESGCHLGPYTVLGSHVRLLANTSLERCVLHDNVYVAAGGRLRGTVIGRASSLRAHVVCDEGVVLGDDVQVGENARLGDNVKVYPAKVIEDGAIVNSSIVWETRGASSLFGREGVSGLANVDITPELAAKVALAYGSSLRKGATVVTSRDTSRASRMLKRAMMAGLNAAGVHVLDLEVASTAVTRFLVASPRAVGGLSVRLHQDDPQTVVVRFFDTSGIDITEDAQRRIERTFQREDYRRVLPEEIGDITYPIRALEEYATELERIVQPEAIRERRYKLVVDYGYGPTSHAMSNVLAKLDIDLLGVNPYASTIGRLRFDVTTAAQRVADLVRASGAHVGAVFDPDGERLTLVDDEGAVLSHTEALLAFIELICDHLLGDRIAIPVHLTEQADAIATAHGVTVQRTKISVPALMAASTDAGVGFAADGAGGYILPGFLPAFDAAAALVKMLDLLARGNRQLSDVRRSVPPVHLTHDTVKTPWEQKGLVMRSLVESADGELVLVDGVKVRRDGSWVLALPDPEDQTTHLWAEGPTAAAAKAAARDYARRIRRVVR
jgi:mannose-1-phosphate guanylyltransferase / phosphomannomutase